jgi:hypothetical protein
MLTTLFHSHSSGRFIFESPRGRKTVFLLNGYPVWAERSNPMDGLPRYLLDAKILTRSELGRIGTDARDSSEVRQRLLSKGLLHAAELDEHLESWVGAEVRSGLGHVGLFRFRRGDDFAGAVPVYEVNPIRALWAALPEYLDLDVLKSELDTLSDRSIGRTRTFNRLFGYVASEQALRSLGEALLRPRRLQEVRSRFPDRSGQVTRCLWFMIHAGLVALSDSPHNEGRQSSLEDSKPRLPAVPKLPPPAERTVEFDTRRKATVDELRSAVPRQTDDHKALIVRDYVTRMELNHYGFLGVAQDASSEQIDEAYTNLAPRYRIQNLSEEIQGDVRRKAKELLSRLVRAFDELSTPTRRTAYDRWLVREAGPRVVATGRIDSVSDSDLDAAQADSSPDLSMVMGPVVEELRWWPGSEDPSTLARRRSRLDDEDGRTLVKAHTEMGKGNWDDAAQFIEGLRQLHPSDAGLLADLGWCRFASAPGKARAISRGMEWADLSLAFDPAYADAIEVRARILSATDQAEDTLQAVKRLLRLRKDSEWGKAQLEALSTPEEAPKGRGLGRFLRGRR